MKKGFNNEQYVKLQTEVIEERIKMFNGKLYLEFGGKLFDDYHAQRILPGFELNSKIRLLEKLKDSLDCNLYFFGSHVNIGTMYIILSITIFVLIGIYVLLNKSKKYNN